jgi:Rod binding domain-containing protein
MKIKAPLAAADNPLNLPRKAGSLKPLTGEDFHGTLAALANPAAAQPTTQPTASPTPTPDSSALQPVLRPFNTDAAIPGFKGQAKPLEPLAAPAPPLIPMAEDDTDFAQGLPRHQEKTPHDKVVETARKLVAQTFYGTMLKQMRNSPFKSEMFEGGRGGQAFAPLLDQHLAEHMARSSDSHLVNAIARKLEGKAAYQQQMSAAKRAVKANQNVRTNVAPSLRA